MNRPDTHIEDASALAFGLKIRNKLNAGVASLDKHTTDSLFQARQRALAHHAPKVSELSLAGLGRYTLNLTEDYIRPTTAALVLVALIVCGDFLTSVQRAADLEEVDSALLADDLPINAYLDRGFDTWLSSSAQR